MVVNTTTMTPNKAAIVKEIVTMFVQVKDFHNPHPRWNSTVFHCTEVPTISIEDYVDRFVMHVPGVRPNQDVIFILAVIYLTRLERAQQCNILCNYSAHKLILAAISVAIKFILDEVPVASCIAAAGGVSVEELSLVEMQFLRLIRFDLFVKEEDYHVRVKAIQQSILRKQQQQ